ncbi:MAG: FAD-binding protein [Actinobacteria bacterium]|nr:FAD-binding protein [Actinomycetota bacterium]
MDKAAIAKEAFGNLDRKAVDELAAALRGDVVGPGDAAYDEQRRIWNGSIDRRPALIARCAGVADVIAAVRFARAHGLLVAVRSGGHSSLSHQGRERIDHSPGMFSTGIEVGIEVRNGDPQ